MDTNTISGTREGSATHTMSGTRNGATMHRDLETKGHSAKGTVSDVLKKSGHEVYENILTIVGVSVLSFLVVAPGILFLKPPLFGIVFMLLTAAPALAAAFYAMRQKLERRPIQTFKYTVFFTGFKKFYGRALTYGLVMAAFTLILVTSWWYYWHNQTLFPLVIALFQTYFYVFVNLAFMYTVPILVSEDCSILTSFHRSLQLFLGNGLYSAGAALQIVTVGALLLVTVISAPLLLTGTVAVFLLNTYENLVAQPAEACKKRE